MRQPPNRRAALDQYRQIAHKYDGMVVMRATRRRAVDLLGLTEGGVVLEVGCGTGLNFPTLRQYIGESGRIIGVDQSSDMIQEAQDRILASGWKNIQLILAPVEEATLNTEADALLFSYTHDILQNPEAVRRATRGVRVGGRVVALCTTWDESARPSWANFLFRRLSRKYVTTFDGFHTPWRYLVEHLEQVKLSHYLWGTSTIVVGRVRLPGI